MRQQTMNGHNFIYSITLSLLFIYAPICGMETFSAIIATGIQTGTSVIQNGAATIQTAVSDYLKTPQQIASEQKEIINKAFFNLAATIKEFQTSNNQLNQANYSQHKINLTNNIESFIKIMKTCDSGLQHRDFSFREELLRDQIRDILHSNVIKTKQIEYLTKAIEIIKKITLEHIEDKANNNPMKMENSSIQLGEFALNYDLNKWPNTAEKQIQYINELEIDNNLKIFLLQVLWDKHKQDKNNKDRILFGNALRQQKASIPQYTDIYLKDQKKSISLPIFVLPANHSSVNTLNINKDLNTIIITLQQKILEYEKPIFNNIQDTVYPEIKNCIKKDLSQSITTLIEYKKSLKIYKELFPKINNEWENTTIKAVIEEISQYQEKVEQRICIAIQVLYEEIKEKINNNSLLPGTLIRYETQLNSYIKILPDDTGKEQLKNCLNLITQKRNCLKNARDAQEKATQEKINQQKKLEQEKAERKAKEKTELEKLEKEKLEKENQKRLDQQKVEKEKLEKAELEAGRIMNLKLMEEIVLERMRKEKEEAEQIKKYKEFIAIQEKLKKEKLEKEAQEKLEKEIREKAEQEAKKKAQEKAALEKLEKERLAKLEKEQEIERLATEKKIKEQVEETLKKETHERKMRYIYGTILTTVASFIALLVYNQDLLKNLLLSINTDTLKNLLSAVKFC